MPLLRPEDSASIQEELSRQLTGQVTVTLVGPSALNPPARDFTPQILELYREVAALSPGISVEYLDLPTPEQRAALGLEPGQLGPITVLSGAARGKVRFVGAPLGYEFGTFVRSLIEVSRGDSGLSAPSRELVAAIATPVHIQVFFTPT